MYEGKKTKFLPTMKLSEGLHEAISQAAQKSHRKITDEVRWLIELGLMVEIRLLQDRDRATERAYRQLSERPLAADKKAPAYGKGGF